MSDRPPRPNHDEMEATLRHREALLDRTRDVLASTLEPEATAGRGNEHTGHGGNRDV